MFAAVFAAGVLAVALTALERSPLVYVAGATPNAPVVGLRPGQEVCQGPIRPPDGARFERVGLLVTPRSGSLTVSVKDATGRTLGRGSTPPGRRGDERHGTPVTAAVGDIRSSRPLKVCVRGAAELYGAPAIGSRQTATLDGREAGFDVVLRLERAEGAPLLGELPEIAQRVSVFHPGWVTPVTLALLALALFVGAPALLLVVLAQCETRSIQSHSPERHNE